MKQQRRHTRLALAGLLLMAAAAPAAAGGTGLPRYGVAVYSDLCVERGSGDIGGQRISLHRYAEGDSLIYEFTAGGLSLPVVASDVSIDDQTGVLTFSVQVADKEERTIFGKFSADGEHLTLTGGYCGNAAYPMRLSKVSNFSRPPDACKACPETPAPAPAPVEPVEPAVAPSVS
jgi:hypothetical protein